MLVLSVALAGCSNQEAPSAALSAGTSTAASPSGGARPSVDAALIRFADCDEFVAHMRHLAESRVTKVGLTAPDRLFRAEYVSDVGAQVAGPPDAVDPGPAVQPDVAVTNGRLVITARLGRLRVVDVSRAKPRLLGSLDIPGHGNEWDQLFLAGDRVLILSPADDEDPMLGFGDYSPPVHTTTLTLVDLHDPAHPTVLSTAEITGRLVTARRTGDVLRVVLATDPETRLPWPNAGLSAAKSQVRDATAADWLPHRQIHDGQGRILGQGPLMACTEVRHPVRDAGLDLLSVLTIDPLQDDPFTAAPSTGVLASGDQVAASASRLFIAGTADWARPSGGGSARTLVHAFDLTSPSGTAYLGSGTLDAFIAGPGALSAREASLRVVTSTAPPWVPARMPDRTPDDVGVAMLTERGGGLVVTGSISGLAGGRSAKVIRWLDDLVAIAPAPTRAASYSPNADAGPMDLVSLTGDQPRFLQELTIPQRSADLVPVGHGHIVGIGLYPGLEEGEPSVEAVALDLRKAGHPRRTDLISYGHGDLYGFVWLPDRRLLVAQGGTEGGQDCRPGPRCVNRAANAESFRVGTDGRLHPTGWTTEGTVIRLLPVGGRLAAVGDGVTMLEPRTLRPLGAVHFPAPRPLVHRDSPEPGRP